MKKVAMLLGVFTLSALPAFAHHGWGGNEDKLTDVTGTVTTPRQPGGPARDDEDQGRAGSYLGCDDGAAKPHAAGGRD